MNRRGFLKGLAAVVGGVALEEAIPFGRVWSFPKELRIVKPPLEINYLIAKPFIAKNRFLTIAEVEALSKEVYLKAFRDIEGHGMFHPSAELSEMYRKGVLAEEANWLLSS